ncbi:hypothetical protein ACFRI7_11675 [Streptomyces sp. NPDC056716]|uniref:hypothetical protein n=1 Tax=unclassified Streptomyces TaxID=2593676 RepID=UPI00369F824C
MTGLKQTGTVPALTRIDERIEAVAGSVDDLWELRDEGVLDEPLAALVDAHRALAEAETGLTFHRVLLHRLTSGEYPVDAVLLDRINRTVDQLGSETVRRDDLQAKALAVLERAEAAQRTAAPPADGAGLSSRDHAALLAIARGARLRQHLVTQRVSVVTSSGTRIGPDILRRLEDAGLVIRDTSHPLHAGQPVTLTAAGRTALAAAHRPPPPATAPAQRAGAWPVTPSRIP